MRRNQSENLDCLSGLSAFVPLREIQTSCEGRSGRFQTEPSEFDRFFAISGLPSGRYKLTMDADQAVRFGLDDNGGKELSLHDDTVVLSGIEAHLTALSE